MDMKAYHPRAALNAITSGLMETSILEFFKLKFNNLEFHFRACRAIHEAAAA